MKFKKEIPRTYRYYWYVDTAYPIPKPCFLYEDNESYWIHELGKEPRQLDEFDMKYLRWGDEIVPSPAHENEIEY